MQTATISTDGVDVVDDDEGSDSGARSLFSAGTAFTMILASVIGLFL